MRGKFLSVLLTMIAFASAAAVAAYARGAIGTSSSLPALPIFNQQPLSLTDDAKTSINNSIGELAAPYGVTAASLDQVRGIAVDGSTMYVVPGSGTNVCLVFGGAAACGAPDEQKHLVALFVAGSDGVLSGGGITDGTPSTVGFTDPAASRASSATKNGEFALSRLAGLHAQRGHSLQLNSR